MQERGVVVDHATVHRWAVKMLPVLAKICRSRQRSVGRSWRMDETYIKVKGQWKFCPVYLIATYMDALSLPSIKSMINIKVRLQPYIRTFIEVFASVPDGICWSSPNHNHALEAHVALQVFLTTV